MNRTFSMFFFIKRSKKTDDGLTPIYLRITIDGKSFEISAKRWVLPEKWDVKSQRQKGASEDARNLNIHLSNLKQKVYSAFNALSIDNEFITVELLKEKLSGKSKVTHTLLPIFMDHNSKCEKLVGTGYAPGTIERYKTTLKHIRDFMETKYKIKDIDIEKIDNSFISEFDFYLRSVRKCGNNSTVKYVKNFKKIIRICMANGWLAKDPFANYKAKVKPVTPIFLYEDELNAIIKKSFEMDRLDQVRDIFVFSCFTGLAFVDVEKLSPKNICIGIDGKKWVSTKRQKTDINSSVPLLPIAEAIVNKYKDNKFCQIKNRLLPVLSNQKMNAYLKEIATVCGIRKELTYHTARHTFATTVTLSNGVPIESVSKMLGHSSIKMTQHYAKITDTKVSRDMSELSGKYAL